MFKFFFLVTYMKCLSFFFVTNVVIKSSRNMKSDYEKLTNVCSCDLTKEF